MKLVKIDPTGVNKDVSGHDLEENVWTDAVNMRFDNNRAEKHGGEELAQATTGDPYHLLFNGSHVSPEWFYMEDGGIRRTNFVNDIDIDGAGSVSSGTDWDAHLFNTIPIFNNTVDAPWTYIDDTQVETLLNFPAGVVCQAIRPFKSFLIALNITDNGVVQSNRVIWSDASDNGDLPPSWDIADPTTLAGDNFLTQERGEIIDGLALRDFFVIYKTHSTTIVQFVGGQSVLRFQKSQPNVGVLAKNCVTEFQGQHFIVADGDILLFDGQNVQSIAEDRVRRYIFDNMDSDNFRLTYVVRYDKRDEIWVCFATTGQPEPNVSAIWNWKDNTWTFRDITGARHIGLGIADFTGSPTYNSFDITPITGDVYDNFPDTRYQSPAQNPTSDTLAKATTNAVHRVDVTNDILGVAMQSQLERVTMDFGEPSIIKMVNKIIPRITALPNTIILISLGIQLEVDDAITWLPEQTFTVGVDREVSTIGQGRFISVRLRTDAPNTTWACHGLEFQIKQSGRF